MGRSRVAIVPVDDEAAFWQDSDTVRSGASITSTTRPSAVAVLLDVALWASPEPPRG